MSQFNTPVPMLLRARPERPSKRDLTKEEQEEIQFAFDTLDADKSGQVTTKQLKIALRALGFEVKKAQVHQLISNQGEEPGTHVSQDTFKAITAEKLLSRTPQDELKRAFQLFDLNGTGKIDQVTLKRIVKSLGLEIKDSELHDMIGEFDADRDGMINEHEFMAIMSAGDDY